MAIDLTRVLPDVILDIRINTIANGIQCGVRPEQRATLTEIAPSNLFGSATPSASALHKLAEEGS